MASILLAAALLLGPEVVSVRCSADLVTRGANKLQVISACGEPEWRETVSASDAVPQEAWIYERTDKGVQQVFVFEGVTLLRIEDGEYLQSGTGGGSLRCSARLMQPGVTKLTVKKQCGEPAFAERTSGANEQLREVWMYERDGVTHELHFSGVRLERVESHKR